MPRLSEHERSGAIGMLKAVMRVSDVVRYHNCHSSTIQCLRDRYQATVTVKDQRRSGQPRMVTVVKSQLMLIVYNDNIRPTSYCQCQTNVRAPRVICF